ncbi:hypothetical protein HL667_29645 [Bradyrhizobium sp. 83012]|uniref:Heme exporter protein D n=1 Tax=Bradyrhizobium aeschynomenes TaxID=2734909 RepID=A0ABX2CPG9_9BRAD|nr:hypothetical protein [Bradyrhizobium aeschynomenes]NPU09265.1 hypothetical protein [Bradyrhizobium aeschynomenes]NPU69202.1 hypothetical protein [Bradyrhizobium aeschynomenes]NPV20585.1 hypothetical protein [Bradyrhizobium aeschynomenes]
MSEMGGLLEFVVVAMCGLGWLVLEWQGRRLDRRRAEREAGERAEEER